jgi:hypothetical protein
MSEDVTRLLQDDAARIRGALARSTAMIGAFFDTVPFDRWAFEAFRSRMLTHRRILDCLVLPVIEETRGAPFAQAEELRVVHAAIATLLAPMPTLPLIAEIRTLLDAHARIEETGADSLFAACDALPTRTSQWLLEQLRTFPDPTVVEPYDAPGTPRTAAAALAIARRASGTARPPASAGGAARRGPPEVGRTLGRVAPATDG